MFAGEFELLLLNVYADEVDGREFLPKDGQDRTDSAADFEEACTRRQVRAVSDQPVSPVLSLLDKPMLLACPVSVNVLGYVSTLGSG
jgi:hypothetical protein